MNYLAHATLSFSNSAVLTGNMISDYVKGKAQYDFPADIQVGIKLHRAIDDFTDHHPSTKKIMELFRPQYRLYSGAFTDIVYDYFLANDPLEYSSVQALQNFTQKTYVELDRYTEFFPVKFARMYPYMKAQNWLLNYRLEEGIQQSFNGLVRRAAYLQESEIAFKIFIRNKDFILEHYNDFYPSVKNFAIHTLNQLLKT